MDNESVGGFLTSAEIQRGVGVGAIPDHAKRDKVQLFRDSEFPNLGKAIVIIYYRGIDDNVKRRREVVIDSDLTYVKVIYDVVANQPVPDDYYDKVNSALQDK